MNIGVLPKPPRFLELSEVLTLHESAIDEFGGSHGVRDKGLLDSALAMPRQSFGDEFVHAIPFGMAAAYAYHICKNYPFVDGNKRTALAAMAVFLHMNGWDLTVQDLEAADQILGIATGTIDKDGLDSWLYKNCRPRSTQELRDFFASVSWERFLEQFTAFSAGNSEKEINQSTQEARAHMPFLIGLDNMAEDLKQTDEPAQLLFMGATVTLTALFRIAEDMGYEW